MIGFFSKHKEANPGEAIVNPNPGSGDTTKPGEGTGDAAQPGTATGEIVLESIKNNSVQVPTGLFIK